MVVGQRGSTFHRGFGMGAFVAAGLLGVAANAQTQQQVEWCNNKGGAFAPDLVISGCTAAIQSHKEPQYLAFAYVNRGDAWTHKRDYDRAIADYNEAIRLGPSPRAFSNRGIVYFNRKAYDRAIADFTEAIRLNPNIAYAFKDRADAYKAKEAFEDDDYKAKEDLDHAIADYSEAIRLDPNFTQAYVTRGRILHGKRDYDRAIADYNHVIRLDPKAVDVYVNRGSAFYLKGDYDRAIADYSEAIRLNPTSAGTFYDRGTANLKKEDYVSAIADYNEAIRLNPHYAKGLLNDPDIPNRVKDQLGRPSAGTFYDRGRANLKKEDYVSAIADFTEAIRLNPNYANGLLNDPAIPNRVKEEVGHLSAGFK
jgi:tetratricopeptide (TPR) repeat protein